MRSISLTGGLVKTQISELLRLSEFLIQWIWSKARECAFLTSSQVMLMLLVWRMTHSRTTNLEEIAWVLEPVFVLLLNLGGK